MRSAQWTGFLVVALILSVSPDAGAALNAHDDGKTVTLENERLRLVFDKSAKGNLSAIIDKQSAQNFLSAASTARQLYVIAFAGEDGTEKRVNNNAAADVRFQLKQTPGEVCLVETFANHAGRQLTATVSVTLRADSPLSAWRIEVQNGAQFLLKSVTFPMLDAPLSVGPGGEGDAIALPVCDGYLIERPALNMSNGMARFFPYPGWMSAQLMAYYGKPAGLYMATQDAAGHPKKFGVTRYSDNLVFSYLHQLPLAKGDGWAMPYDFVLGTFTGDWHAAADLYKAWAVKQPWCAKPLAQRDDIAAWVKEAPTFHTLAVRALDARRQPFNALPILPAHVRSYNDILGHNACALLMKWERHGAWVTPDYFPPFGGAEQFSQTVSELGKDSNRAMVYLSGLRWTLKNKIVAKEYDGAPSFQREAARWATVAENGKPDIKDQPSEVGVHANLCQATRYAKDLLTRTALECVALGIACVQMDQMVGLGTPPCYSKEHGHPPGYGVWQYEGLRDLFTQMRRQCRQKHPGFAMSLEGPAELAIPLLDVYDAREYEMVDFPRRPGVRGVPLFTYLYHEYTLGFGGDRAVVGGEPSDEFVMQHAINLVCGKTPGVAEWGLLLKPAQVHPAQIRMLKAHTALLRTPARDYLVMGRMIHPLPLNVSSMTINPMSWRVKKTFPIEMPTVLHSGWTLPNGNRAYVFANISRADVPVNCELPALAETAALATLSAYSTDTHQRTTLATAEPLPKKISFILKPQEAYLVEITPAEKGAAR
ncbi:MAG: DUF6259 domain-containing protein [Verrucomicrobia bacterium]|nr:DUF6259 domain-containing protein [Verrucomicrobiota bacterium]